MRHIVLLFVSVFFILASCSKEGIQDISAEDLEAGEKEANSSDFVKSNELLTSNFLPAFTSYYGRDRGTSTNRSSSLASEWVHEYDDKGKLVKSFFFELFPYRILEEVTYLDIVEDNKLTYEIKEYSYYGLFYSFTDTHDLTFDDNLNIERVGSGEVLEEFTDEGWVTKISSVDPNGNVVYQTGYEYDEQGNILKYISYGSPGVGTSTVDYSYNENGDPLSYHFQNSMGEETMVNYYYREDNTLERLEEEYDHRDGEFGTKIFTYTPEERFLKRTTNRGDGSRDVITYTEDDIIAEYFKDDLLSEVYIYQIQEVGYSVKLHKEYLNGVIHTIKYYDADGELEYTEYYDENGDLTSTVHE